MPMIRTKEEEQKYIDMIYKRMTMTVPEGWKMKVKTQPYLFCDVKEEVKKEEKVMLTTVYSARFPSSLTMWLNDVAETWDKWIRKAHPETQRKNPFKGE